MKKKRATASSGRLKFFLVFFNVHAWTKTPKSEARGHLAARKSDSLQYGYGAVSLSPQRQRASKELGFSREKNIYK